MFEAAELGQHVSKEDYDERVPLLRQELLRVQRLLAEAEFPVVLLLGGVDKAGKGESANQLTYWMDPRRLVTRAYDEPTQEETERPEQWRYWRDMPARGHIGIFLSAWYSRPLLDRVHGRASKDRFDVELERIRTFERTLADDGTLIVKIWMHLGRDAQRKRLEELQTDPLTRWRVKQKDWMNLELYDEFVAAAEHTIMRTSVGLAPWTIVEGADPHYRSLRVGTIVLEAIERRLEHDKRLKKARKALKKDAEAKAKEHLDSHAPEDIDDRLHTPIATVLDRLDMTQRLPKREYQLALKAQQARLHRLHLRAIEAGISTIIVFEGWDAAGKGGAIRRLLAPLDARRVQVIPIAAPTDEEHAQHYLWRFWRHLPRAGRVTIFDRSWYGRVLVERLEGFAMPREWRRAYGEINEFEQQLVEHGDVVVKFWLHITQDEQEARFEAREKTPHKRWKLTEEDWRNRERWDDYEHAVNEMIERTSTHTAPWHLIEANDKRFARVRVLEEVCAALEKRLAPLASQNGSPTAEAP